MVAAPFELEISAAVGKPYARTLKAQLVKAHALVDTQLQSLSVALVGDALMSKLHIEFMNIAGPTDVLTFELDHDASGHVTTGEVVICVPEARRQAKEHGTKPEHELLLYAIHGLLHLSGYDDLTEADFLAIHREEDRVLTALNVGPVFAPAKSDGQKVRRHKLGRKKDGRSR